MQLYQQWNSDNIGYRIARTVAHKRTTISKWDCRAADKDSFQFGGAERTSPGGYFAEIEQQRRRIEYRWMKGTNAMFYLTYNYTNARRSRMAIACVIRCKNTYGKQLRVRDIIEMHRPGLYQLLSRGDKCRVGRAISRLYNQGMLPHLNRGKKKGSTNTYYC